MALLPEARSGNPAPKERSSSPVPSFVRTWRGSQPIPFTALSIRERAPISPGVFAIFLMRDGQVSNLTFGHGVNIQVALFARLELQTPIDCPMCASYYLFEEVEGHATEAAARCLEITTQFRAPAEPNDD